MSEEMELVSPSMFLWALITQDQSVLTFGRGGKLEKILHHIEGNGGITDEEFSEEFDCDDGTRERYISNLTKLGYVYRSNDGTYRPTVSLLLALKEFHRVTR